MKTHFIGIGGIGMSALAHLELAKGNRVSGSDIRPNNLTDELAKLGGIVYQGHSRENVKDDVDVVVRSFCIKMDNPEVLRARELGIPVITRSEMLYTTLNGYSHSFNITGTHGKTTSTSLVAHIMKHCGKDPTILAGGEIFSLGANARKGSGGIAVAEVDESDGYFRKIHSHSAIITNLEREHIENYGSFDDLVKAYGEFIGNISKKGLLVFNGEDLLLGRVASSSDKRVVSFGINGDFEYKAVDYICDRAIEFTLIVKGETLFRVKSSLLGRYNIMNILGAVALCFESGLGKEEVIRAVSSFRGVKRRFEKVGDAEKVEVFEDYAHHPTEISSVIGAALNYSRGRVIVVFQPHRYSRTKDLLNEFAKCFYGAHVLVLTDIYSADEDVDKSISSKDVYNAIDRNRFEDITFIRKEKIPAYIAGITKEKDVVMILGAGDIREVAPPVLEAIKTRKR